MNKQQVDVTKLSTEQLQQLYKQIYIEMEALQKTAPIIQNAITACQDAIDSIHSLKGQQVQNDVLLPVSESAYAYGQIQDVEKVLVGIGCGFVAELASDKAIAFYESRLSNRKGEMAKLRQALGQQQLTRDQLEIEIRLRTAPQEQKE